MFEENGSNDSYFKIWSGLGCHWDVGLDVGLDVSFFIFFADIQFCKTALDVSLVKSNVDFMKKKSFLSQDGSRLT